MPINPDQVYTATLSVESVGDSGHFRMQVTYDPPIPELGLTGDPNEAIPAAYSVVSNLVPIVLADNPVDLGQNDDEDTEVDAGYEDNVVSLFPSSDAVH